MNAVNAIGAGYRFPSGGAIGPVDLAVGAGERVVLSGASGAGKTTLLRRLAGLSAKAGFGEALGAVSVGGVEPMAMRPADRPRAIGFVAQDPGDQLVCGTVADELAFGPECAGMPSARVEALIPAILAQVGLGVDPGRDPRTLSTGEQQRLVVGAAIAAGARLLLLDEPLAHLDPDGADALLEALRRIAADGVAVIAAEHRLAALAGFADREVRLDAGRIVFDGRFVPPAHAAEPSAPHQVSDDAPARLEASGLRVGYGAATVLDGVDLRLRAGERVALVGANGAGKSTLIGALCGRLPCGGALSIAGGGRALEVPQDPDLTLFCATVAAELGYGPAEHGLDGDALRAWVDAIARGMGLAALVDRSPHALSRGERLRVAVGAAVACRPAVLALDEPTAGQDHAHVEAMFDAVDRALGDGALVFATHDRGLAARRATRVLRLAGGRLHADGGAR